MNYLMSCPSVAAWIGICLTSANGLSADEPKPIAHWPLSTDVREVGQDKLVTTNVGATFEKSSEDDAGGKGTGAARFDGRSAHLSASVRALPRFATADFTVALWLNADDALSGNGGELISHYDSKRRTGWQLGLRTNTGVTSSQANWRQLQFGIDAATIPQWRDEGRPGNAILAFSLAVHDGQLYAGTCEPAKDDAGHVYRYEAPGKWIDLGTPDRCNAISAMAEFDGRLYVGSAKYRLAGSALTESENPHSGGKIFRLEADGKWAEVGRLAEDQTAVGGMVVYRDRLYATSLYKPAGFSRYERDGQWTSLPAPDGLRVESLGVFHDYLWATSYDGGYVFRFDGQAWKSFGVLGDNTQTYSFAIHRGKLCVGTWPSGCVFQLDDTEKGGWTNIGQLGQEREVMGMNVHNGQFYAGTLPAAEVYRYDGAENWSKIGRLDLTPDVTYRRAWTMAQYQGRLFVSTLPSGNIHSMEAGKCVTCDQALEPGWRHVAAVKDRDRLRLFVDGRQVAESTEFAPMDFDLSNEAAILIGTGASDNFRGRLRDVRIYHQALTADQLQAIGGRGR